MGHKAVTPSGWRLLIFSDYLSCKNKDFGKGAELVSIRLAADSRRPTPGIQTATAESLDSFRGIDQRG